MKKKNSKTGRYLLITLAILFLLPLLTGNAYLYKMIRYNFADIDDYKIFDNNIVAAGSNPRYWEKSDDYTNSIPDTLDEYLTRLKSVALLVIQNKKIRVERYWQGYSDNTVSGSFSMAKSIVSLLVGAAIKEGKISSVEDPVSKYLPEFNEGERAQLKIVHLLTMSSGSDWCEDYANPFSVTTRAYYDKDLSGTAQSVKFKHTPGTLFSYKSGDTQLLGLIVEKATGKSLATYASEKLWQPLGAAHDALWSVDQPGGHEKAYCCFNSNARDFARLGQLMLDSGMINSQPVIDRSYFEASIKPNMIADETGTPCNYYGYQWWMLPGDTQIYYARGILGQYIICIPAKNIVVVRLGEKRDEKIGVTPAEVFKLIDWAKKF